MIRVAELFTTEERGLQALSLQCGVTSVIGAIDFRSRPGLPPDGQPWSRASLARMKRAYEDAGTRAGSRSSRW
ncbi:MAG: hypothetical protein NTU62_14725 [Spirochaetes bacterium]|nr:hypothetical protein [Spirochaetota bacterium]